jgi:hypothetical protein
MPPIPNPAIMAVMLIFRLLRMARSAVTQIITCTTKEIAPTAVAAPLSSSICLDR